MRILLISFFFFPLFSLGQLKWKNLDSLYGPLPPSVHVYYTNDSMFDGKPNIAYYVIADLKDKKLEFATDTTDHRRLTPSQFYERNGHPLLVVNCTFFEYAHETNLNLVMRKGKVIASNQHSLPMHGKDTLKYLHVFPSALGISKKRTADVVWTWSRSKRNVMALPEPMYWIDSSDVLSKDSIKRRTTIACCDGDKPGSLLYKWKMRTAVGGGPVLLQNGDVHILNNEERKFTGKAINDKHPRTAMGYTKDNKLIILVVQGRYPNIAEGATLTQEAQILKSLGCIEALNLDGGGSSCLLLNGRQTVKPSEKGEQRPVPAVFMIRTRK